jgi:hypothetical protein
MPKVKLPKAKSTKKLGRPSLFTQDLADVICNRLEQGQSLREIGRDPKMPCDFTVRRWLMDGKHEAFCAQYAQARELQADRMFEEMLEISDDGTNDWMTRNRRGLEVIEVDNDHINRSKLRVDTRKWILARMSPKKYQERTAVEHSGAITLEDLIAGSEPVSRIPALTNGSNGHSS